MNLPKTAIIKPYVNKSIYNMGLEKNNEVVFPNTYQSEAMGYIQLAGENVKRYLTGLDESSPMVAKITDHDTRNEYCKNIRLEVRRLEKMLFNNYQIEDSDLESADKFWKKVTKLHSTNHDFWKSITLEKLTNSPYFLDVENNPKHALLFHGIIGGGFTLVAKSYKDAAIAALPPKFYLEYEDNEAIVETENKRNLNKAIAYLSSLDEEGDTFKMFYIIRSITHRYKDLSNTAKSQVLYNIIDKYLNGELDEVNKLRAANNFIKLYKLDNKELVVTALVNTLISNNSIIYDNLNKVYFSNDLQTRLGKDKNDVVKFLISKENEELLERLVGIYNQFREHIGKKNDIEIDIAVEKKTNPFKKK